LQKTLEPIWEEDSTGYQWDVKGHPYKDFNKAKDMSEAMIAVRTMLTRGQGDAE
jgi:hypothetical protein